MPSLLLELATDRGDHYEVLDEARNVVGHIVPSDAKETPRTSGASRPSHLAGVLEDGKAAVMFHMFVEAHAALCLPEDASQSRLATEISDGNRRAR
jgi:hypothetical protein